MALPRTIEGLLLGRGKPHRFVEEERLGQDDATNLEIFLRIVSNSSIMDEALAHLNIGSGPVALLEGLPRQAYGEDRKRGEDPSASDQVLIMRPLASMEFKRKMSPFMKCAKRSVRRRLPEIDLCPRPEARAENRTIPDL